MALSEAEEEWLERRKILCTHCDLISREICKGEKNKTSCQLWKDYHCNNPVKGYKAFQDMQDAAEFEARVQKWLMYQYEKAYQCKEVSDGFLPDRGTMLMFARLAAEAEMDK